MHGRAKKGYAVFFPRLLFDYGVAETSFKETALMVKVKLILFFPLL